MATIDQLGLPWAEEGPVRAPSTAEIKEGFPDGPAEKALFNYLMRRALQVEEAGEAGNPPLLFFGCL